VIARTLVIAGREFMETVKTRAFLLGVVLMPLLILGVVFGTRSVAELAEREALPPRRVVVLDEDGRVFKHLQRAAVEYNRFNPQRPFDLILAQEGPAARRDDALHDPTAYAQLEITAAAVRGEEPVRLVRRDNQLQAREALAAMVESAVKNARLDRADVPSDHELRESLLSRVPITTVDARTGVLSEDGGFAAVMAPFAFMFLLYMATMGISWGLLTSVLEEKSSRVVEVLLSAVSPTQLMAGKILGMVMVGALMLGIWAVVGYQAAERGGAGHLVGAARLAYVVLYFIPGFLLTSSLLAGVGAACNTLKEAQAMAAPLSLINIALLVLWIPISQNPGSAFSVALSFVPPLTPFVMILRICADPDLPLWQIVATLGVLWASVGAAVWAAAKVFRVGVLLYGKPPTLREMLHWVRYA
jgi:ABC-2 type transport system permease protein